MKLVSSIIKQMVAVLANMIRIECKHINHPTTPKT